MANWKHEIKIGPLMEALKSGDKAVHEGAREIAELVRAAVPQRDQRLEEILADFDSLDEDSGDEDFNYVIDDLYDWGDEGHRLWVDSFTTH